MNKTLKDAAPNSLAPVSTATATAKAHATLDDHRVESFNSFLVDLAKETDRAAVIIGAAKIDILLRQMLQRSLQPCATSRDELLDAEGPLSTFSARTAMCFRLGLINAELARAINVIRRIRNDLAHEASNIDLRTGSYADRISELIAPIKNLTLFKQGWNLPAFAHCEGHSRSMRVTIAYLGAALEEVVENVEQMIPSLTAPFVIGEKDTDD